jgi:hypothetical protein
MALELGFHAAQHGDRESLADRIKLQAGQKREGVVTRKRVFSTSSSGVGAVASQNALGHTLAMSPGGQLPSGSGAEQEATACVRWLRWVWLRLEATKTRSSMDKSFAKPWRNLGAA